MFGSAVLAVCGFSGSGKTTLIEQALPALLARGLAVAVIKHDAHGLDVDRPGKDSDRLFRAGADVRLAGPGENLLRVHSRGPHDLSATLQLLSADHDLILIEGHKLTPLPKVWVAGAQDTPPPAAVTAVLAVLKRADDPVGQLKAVIDRRLKEEAADRPLFGGILMGGKSRRMGRPKQLLKTGSVSFLEHTRRTLELSVERVLPLGSGPLPVDWDGSHALPDPFRMSGPVAGMLAAMRWAPEASWLITACDQPRLSAEAFRWLQSHRAPGRWVVMARCQDGLPEPLPMLLEPQARRLLEALARTDNPAPRLLALQEHVLTVAYPRELAEAWENVNTPGDLIDQGFGVLDREIA